MAKVSLIAACLITLFFGYCAAEPGDVAWTARYLEEYSGWAQSVACQGNKVYAAGQTWPGEDISKDSFALVAYNAKTGAPLWSESGTEGSVGKAVRATPARVFAAGTRTVGEQSPLFVKSYNAASGRVAWERLWPEGGSAVANDIVVDTYGTRLLVAGSTVEDGRPDGFFTVLCLNVTNGTTLWEQGGTGAQASKGDARALAVNSGKVFAVGSLRDDALFRDGFAVRAYNLLTGKLVWEDVQWSDGEGHAGAYLFSYATAVAATFNRVYVAGSIRTADGGGGFVIRAYDAATGRLTWSDRYDGHTYFDDAAYSVQVRGGRVFVGGFVARPSSGRAYTVRAYDAAKGKLLWSSTEGGYNIEENAVSALAAADNAVYGAGTAKDGTALTVRAYHVKTGDILWEDFFPPEVVLEGFGSAFAVCASGSSIFAGGAAMVDDISYGFTVRAYSAR